MTPCVRAGRLSWRPGSGATSSRGGAARALASSPNCMSQPHATLAATYCGGNVTLSKRPSGTLEAECAALESACDSLSTTLKAAAKAERALHRAAADGDLAKIRRLAAQLSEYAGVLESATRHAATTWTWSESDEEAYLAQGYEQELIDAGAVIGVRLTASTIGLPCCRPC